MFLHKSGSRQYTLRGALFYRKLRAKNCLEEVQREAILFSLLVHRSHLNIILLKHVGLTEKRKKKVNRFSIDGHRWHYLFVVFFVLYLTLQLYTKSFVLNCMYISDPSLNVTNCRFMWTVKIIYDNCVFWW